MKISGGWMTGRSGLTEGNSNAVIGMRMEPLDNRPKQRALFRIRISQ